MPLARILERARMWAVAIGLVAIIGVIAFTFGMERTHAQFPSGKSTVAVSDLTLIAETSAQGWTTILSSLIKPPGGNRALFIDVSLNCALFTQTEVRSRGGNKDTSTAQGTVTVRVLLNGAVTYPGEVVFCDRFQSLSAALQGIVDIVDDQLEIVDDETIELIQRTMSAHAFNFIGHPLNPSTVYTVEVQARVDSSTSAQQGSASAVGAVGKGAVTVDAVRLVRGDEILTTE